MSLGPIIFFNDLLEMRKPFDLFCSYLQKLIWNFPHPTFSTLIGPAWNFESKAFKLQKQFDFHSAISFRS